MREKAGIFLIDIDGVACEHAKAICEWISDEYGIKSKVEDVTTWDHDFGPISFCDAVEKLYPNENFILNMEVAPGFGEFLKHISKMMDVRFASARKYSHRATRLWIEKNFGEYKTVFVRSKTDVEFKYLLEDNLDEAQASADRGKTCFLLRRPWNDNPSTMKVVRNVRQVYFVESFTEIIDFFDEGNETTINQKVKKRKERKNNARRN